MVDVDTGAGEASAVDETGVVEGVAEDDIVAAGQRTEQSEIGDETAAEDQGRLGTFPCGQRMFQRPQRRQQAGHQRRRPGAAAVSAGGAGGGGGQARVGGEIQIIIGGKVDEIAAMQADARSLGGLQASADAVETAAAEGGQVVVEPAGHGIFPRREAAAAHRCTYRNTAARQGGARRAESRPPPLAQAATTVG